MAIYSESLSDLSDDQIRQSVGRAIRELKFFPRVAELRDLAGVAAKDTRNVEAEAAWKWANDYLRKWGVDLMPLYSNGKRIEAPAIPPRIAYALRRIGDLRGLNQVTAESRPFMFRDFCEAFTLAPIADSLKPQLTAAFPIAEGQVKQLSDGTNERREVKPATAPVPTVRSKPFSQPLTDAQRRERYEMLRQQAAYLRPAQARHIEGMPNQSGESHSDPLGTLEQERA